MTGDVIRRITWRAGGAGGAGVGPGGGGMLSVFGDRSPAALATCRPAAPPPRRHPPLLRRHPYPAPTPPAAARICRPQPCPQTNIQQTATGGLRDGRRPRSAHGEPAVSPWSARGEPAVRRRPRVVWRSPATISRPSNWSGDQWCGTGHSPPPPPGDTTTFPPHVARRWGGGGSVRPLRG